MQSRRVPAVVLGLNPNALGTIRALAGAGVPVIAFDARPAGPADIHRWMSSRTRRCRKVLLPSGSDARAIVAALLERGPHFVREFGQRLPIIPSGDDHVLAMAAARDRLAELYEFVIPDDGLLARLEDKAETWELTRQLAVPSPTTLVSPPVSDLAHAAAVLRFPCIVKPFIRDASWEREFPNVKGFVVHDDAELARVYEGTRARHEDLVVQEVIPGPDSELAFSHLYVGRDGVERALWTGHKVRQLPIHVGTSTAARGRTIPRVAELTRRIVEALGIRGYVSIEFKHDARDGEYKLIEITPARTWYPHFLGPASGVNLPLAWYADLCGVTIDVENRFREGVLWVDEYRDLFAALAYRRAGELSLGDWLRSYRSPLAPALCSFTDPMPGIFIALRLALGVSRGLRSRLGRRRNVVAI